MENWPIKVDGSNNSPKVIQVVPEIYGTWWPSTHNMLITSFNASILPKSSARSKLSLVSIRSWKITSFKLQITNGMKLNGIPHALDSLPDTTSHFSTAAKQPPSLIQTSILNCWLRRSRTQSSVWCSRPPKCATLHIPFHLKPMRLKFEWRLCHDVASLEVAGWYYTRVCTLHVTP
jgi:hypothetical protein